MTIAIKNIDEAGGLAVVALLVADKAKFNVVSQKEPKDGSFEVTYRKSDGDDDYPMTLRVGIYKNDAKSGMPAYTNISAKLTTYVEETDSSGDRIWIAPCYQTFASSMPVPSGVPDVADYKAMAQNLISWILPLVSGVVSDLAIDELRFGVATGLASHIDTAA